MRGIWRCEDLPGRWRPRWPAREQDRRRRRRWQRRSWEGVSPGAVRQDWVGVHAVSAKKVDAAVGVAGARANLLGVAGASASGKSILPSWRETAAPTPLACCLGLGSLPDSLECFLLFRATSGSVSGPPVPRACLSCHEGTVFAEPLSLCRWKPCVFFQALQLTSLLEEKKTLKIFVGMLTRLVCLFYFLYF